MPMRRKQFALLAVALLLLSTMCVATFAHTVPDASRKGSIRVCMHAGEVIVPGGSLTLYRVGDVTEDDGNYSFSLTEAFRPCGEALDEIQSAQLAKDLASYALEHGISGTREQIGDDGSIVFSELELGLYLLVQEEAAPGYSKAQPFLVSVPFHENGDYVYDVNASPKLDNGNAPEPTLPPTTPVDPNLPVTGQLWWPVPLLLCAGFICIVVGLIFRRGASREVQ